MTISFVDIAVLEILKDIKDALREGNPPDAGICSAVAVRMWWRGMPRHETVSLLEEHFPLWPEYSGDLGYPVPAPDRSSPASYYSWARSRDMWSGPYGDARRRLLDFLIQRFEEVTQCVSDT